MTRVPLLVLAAALSLPAAVARQAPRYLPPKALDAKSTRFYEDWFGKHLASMDEPALWTGTAASGFDARVRLLVLPSFSAPYVVRIDRPRTGTATVHVTVTGGRGGYGTGPIARRYDLPLDRAKWRDVEDALSGAAFDRRTADRTPSEDEFGDPSAAASHGICLDGTQLVVEHVADGHDHFVTRHQCELDDAMTSVVTAILAAAGLEVDKDSFAFPSSRQAP